VIVLFVSFGFILFFFCHLSCRCRALATFVFRGFWVLLFVLGGAFFFLVSFFLLHLLKLVFSALSLFCRIGINQPHNTLT